MKSAEVAGVTFSDSVSAPVPKFLNPGPVSSEISDLLLFFSHFVSQNKEIKSGNYFFDVCCVNQNILARCQEPTTSYSTGITLTIENFRTLALTSIVFLFLTLNQTLIRHTYLNTNS